jgi:hypothetical protein
MPEPFVSADRRADLFTDVASRVEVATMNKQNFDKKDAEMSEDFGENTADAVASDEEFVTAVGQRWVKPVV